MTLATASSTPKRTTESFLGRWEVLAGPRQNTELTLEEAGGAYRLLNQNGNPIRTDLALDEVARNLGNNRIGLSLYKDFDHLFAIEWIDGEPAVWAAERKAGQGKPGAPGEGPDWRLGQVWTVRTTSGAPPTRPSGQVRIEKTGSGFEISQDGKVFDQLENNPANRTLDGTHRTVAVCQRSGGSNFLFGMVKAPLETVEKIRSLGVGIQGAEQILAEDVRGLLPCEIELLAYGLVEGTSVGVWGAEEGG